MNSHRNVSRRDFLKAAAAAVAAPYIIQGSALGLEGRPAPSNRINMGVIGLGGQGNANLGGLLGNSDAMVLAVCDVDTRHREDAQKRVEQRYAQEKANGTYKGCEAYGDFRDLIGKAGVDAVLIATPDHWHALVTIAALKAGKDVYCEKPLTATIGEGRAVVSAVRRYGRVLQTGSHERSNGACRFACELARNQVMGKIHTIRVQLPCDNHRVGPAQPEPIPEGFDYNMWLGPAPYAPYHHLRCHGNFRWIMDYSDGELTDRGAHVGDLALWGTKGLLKGPVEIEGRGDFPKDGLYDVPMGFNVTHTYANGIKLIVTSEGPRGFKIEGERGWIFCAIHGGALSAEPASLLKEEIPANGVHLKRSPGHHQDFLNCIKDRSDPVALVEGGYATATLCHSSLIAMLLGRKVTWDFEKEQFLNDAEANRMIWHPMRAPWHV